MLVVSVDYLIVIESGAKIDGHFISTVNRGGSYPVETKGIPTTSENSDSPFNTHSTVEDWRNWGEMESNEPGRQKLGG